VTGFIASVVLEEKHQIKKIIVIISNSFSFGVISMKKSYNSHVFVSGFVSTSH